MGNLRDCPSGEQNRESQGNRKKNHKSILQKKKPLEGLAVTGYKSTSTKLGTGGERKRARRICSRAGKEGFRRIEKGTHQGLGSL